MIGDRFATPRTDTRTTTPRDAERWERAHGPEVDRDWNEARDSDFVMGGDVPEDHPLMLAWRRVQNGWRP